MTRPRSFPCTCTRDSKNRHRVKELKTTLMTETLAYVQVALDNAAAGLAPGGENPATGL